MIAWLRSFLQIAPHLKVSTLTGQPAYYAYINEGWQAIPKARFDQLLNSGHFYQHQAASSKHELIYNRRTAKRS